MSSQQPACYGEAKVPLSREVIARACEAAFGKPLVVNNLRPLLVEAMLAEVLSPKWRWVSADWAGWDFQNQDGIRLEVKQSAAKQSWSGPLGTAGKSSFDIAPRIGIWVGDKWFPAEGGQRLRNAHVYVFAYHPVFDQTADHREPRQWHFYVVGEPTLPIDRKSISLSRVGRLASPVGIHGLLAEVERVICST